MDSPKGERFPGEPTSQPNMQDDDKRPNGPNNQKNAAPGSKSWAGKMRSRIPANRRHQSIIVISILIVGLAIWGAWRYFSIRESTDDAKIDGDIVPVASRVTGTVLAVNVKDYQFVKAGTVLVQLDPTDYKVALAHAKADLAVAQANANAARTGVPVEVVNSESQVDSAEASLQQMQAGMQAAQMEVESTQASLVAAQAHLREAEAGYVKAEQDKARLLKLVEKDEVSRQQYDAVVAAAQEAMAGRDNAAAKVKEADKVVEAARDRLIESQKTVSREEAAVKSAGTAPQRVSISLAQAAAANARVLLAKAEVDQAQLNLQYTSITAPAEGMVSNKTVQLGQVVQSGEIMLSLAPIEGLWVTANFKETQLEKIRPGQRAVISVDALGGQEFAGHVESLSGATSESFSVLPSENVTGNFVKVVQRLSVKIVFERGQDPEYRLRVGMSVEPTIKTD
jgi:membrane fusion protein, multidrug efflux system